MQSICVAYWEITCHFLFVLGSVDRMSAGTATSSLGGPGLPQLCPVGEDEQTGVGGAVTSSVGVNRPNGLTPVGSDGLGHMYAD